MKTEECQRPLESSVYANLDKHGGSYVSGNGRAVEVECKSFLFQPGAS